MQLERIRLGVLFIVFNGTYRGQCGRHHKGNIIIQTELSLLPDVITSFKQFNDVFNEESFHNILTVSTLTSFCAKSL